jgi:hypothetical protein
MRRTSTLLTLAAGLACLGPAHAQEYITAPAAPAVPLTSRSLAPAALPPSGAPVNLDHCAAAVYTGACCAEGGRLRNHKRYCVPEPTVTKKTHICYSMKVDEVCCAHCSLCGLRNGLFGKKCCDCGDGCNRCGRVRCRHRLVKKIITEECPVTKCVPPPTCCPEPSSTCPTLPQTPAWK